MILIADRLVQRLLPGLNLQTVATFIVGVMYIKDGVNCFLNIILI